MCIRDRLKPINENELAAAINRHKKGFITKHQALNSEAIAQALSMLTNTSKTQFIVKVGEHIRIIPIKGIALFFSSDKYIFIRTNSERDYGIDLTLKQVMTMVNPDYFFFG